MKVVLTASRPRLVDLALLFIGFVFAGTSSAALIDFEDGTSRSLVDGFYADRGVFFSNAEWLDPTLEFGVPLAGMSGTIGITAPGTLKWQQGNAVVATFPDGASRVSVLGSDLGGNGLRIDAYDAEVGGSLINFDETFGNDLGIGEFATVQVSGGPPIRRVEIYQAANVVADDEIVLDDLRFTPYQLDGPQSVPALSDWMLVLLTLLIMTLGVVGLRSRWS